MKKFYLLTKTLLVMALLSVGVSNAWGVDYLTTYTGIVGAKDNTSGFNTKGNKQMSLAAGDEYVITFVNYNKGASGTDYWENWAFCSNVFNCRADHGASNPYWGSATNVSYTGDSWSDIYSTNTQWLRAYNGVSVTLTVSRNAAGTGITVSHTATTNAVDAIASQTYAGTFTATVGASDVINFYLTCEDAHLNITSVVYNGTEFNYESSESAYVDYGNSTTNYNGESVDNLLIYSTQYRDWGTNDGAVKFNANGKLALYKFDLTAIKEKLADEGGTITGITFSVYGHSNDSGGPTNSVRVLGYNPEWSSSTVTHSNLTNNSGTITGIVSATGSFQPLNVIDARSFAWAGTTLEENALTYVNSAIAADKDYVTIALAANYTRQAVLNTFANMKFTYAAETLYEATFTETNSLNPTVTVYTDNERTSPIAKNELEANTTYYYTAVLEGYYDYEGSFDVETSDPDVNFTMTVKPRYTFTVNAVNSVGGATIKALYTDDDSYDGKAHRVYFPAYLTGAENVVTYSKDNTTYYADYVSASASATQTQSYTAYTGDAWFFEGEDVTGATTYTGTYASKLSNGASGVLSEKTIKTLEAGCYKVTARIIGRLGKDCQVYTTSKSGDKILDIATSTTGATSNADITLDAETAIVADGGYYTTSENGWGFDYIFIMKYPDNVSVTVSSAGYATYVAPYDLNFTSTDIKANKAQVNTTTGAITLDKVDEVPAGTPVVLYYEGGKTENIPVMTGASAVSDNDLKAGTGVAVAYDNGDGKYNYVLDKQDDVVGFYKAADLTVPTDRAYLQTTYNVAGTGARGLRMVFGDAITGINEAAAEVKAAKDGKFFKDGKLFIFKNGMKFNAAGAQVK